MSQDRGMLVNSSFAPTTRLSGASTSLPPFWIDGPLRPLTGGFDIEWPHYLFNRRRRIA
jgi:hypothetical protein